LIFEDEAELELAESEEALTNHRSWEELLLQYYPIPLYSALVSFPAVYLVDLDTPVLLISSFPGHFQTPVMIGFCLLAGVLAHAIYLTWLNYGAWFALSFILTFTAKADSEMG
jgi:hypothetical protein